MNGPHADIYNQLALVDYASQQPIDGSEHDVREPAGKSDDVIRTRIRNRMAARVATVWRRVVRRTAGSV